MPKRIVYIALNSVPDYTAPAPSFKSVHHTLEGAILALYPDREDFRIAFSPSRYVPDTWNGPDGFGTVKRVEIKE